MNIAGAGQQKFEVIMTLREMERVVLKHRLMSSADLRGAVWRPSH
jgi:hypothetical protein